MIDTIEVINFQSHEHSIIELHHGVNVIKGTSHHGKSSIIRAMKWLLFNQPRGAGFKSHFASMRDPVEVGAIFSEGAWVSRIRDNENKYMSDDFTLKALKTDVPDEVNAITQVNYVNFQSQADPYFLIGDTPGQAGKKLNELVGLEIIDEVKKKVTQKINLLGVELKLTDKNLNETIESLEEFKHIDEAENLVSQIESLVGRRNEQEERNVRVANTVQMVKANQKAVLDLTKWLKVEKDYLALDEQVEILEGFITRQTKINTLLSQIAGHSVVVFDSDAVMGLEPDLNKLINQFDQAVDLRIRYDILENLCYDISKLKLTILSREKMLIRASERRTELETQLKYCQYCGSDRKYWRK